MRRDENMVLLACLSRSVDLMAEAVTRLGGRPLFDNMVDSRSEFIWSALSGLYEATATLPSRDLFMMELGNMLSAMAVSLGPSFQSDVRSVADMVYDFDPGDEVVKVGRLYLDRAVEEALTRDWRAKAAALASMDDMRKYAVDVSTSLAGAASRQASMVKPLANFEKFLVHKDRHPFGIRSLDLVTGGGLAAGECMGLLGPTGGGKTVMSIGMVCERALRARNVVLASYEQPAEGDVTERIATYMTGFDIDEFRDKEYTELSPEVLEALKEAREHYGEHLAMLDMARSGMGFGGAEELTGHMDHMISEGRKPELVVVDWLGSMVSRFMAANGYDDNAFPAIAQMTVDVLNSHCRTHGYSLVVVHQLSTDKARVSPSVKPKATDAYKFRAFSYFMDGCVCIGTRDSATNVCWLCADKQRRGAVQETMARLVGVKMRFESASGYTLDHRGKFVPDTGLPPDLEDEESSMNENIKEAFNL